MNRFENAKILAKINEKIENDASEFGIGYKPMDNNLEPQKYGEHGFLRGQQELLEKMLDKHIITIHDLKKIYRDE